MVVTWTLCPPYRMAHEIPIHSRKNWIEYVYKPPQHDVFSCFSQLSFVKYTAYECLSRGFQTIREHIMTNIVNGTSQSARCGEICLPFGHFLVWPLPHCMLIADRSALMTMQLSVVFCWYAASLGRLLVGPHDTGYNYLSLLLDGEHNTQKCPKLGVI